MLSSIVVVEIRVCPLWATTDNECGSEKSLTIMLGGYPHTITKTLNHEKQKENETRLCLWTTETIIRLRSNETTHHVYTYTILHFSHVVIPWNADINVGTF